MRSTPCSRATALTRDSSAMLTPASSNAPPDLEHMVVLRPGGHSAQGESQARFFSSWEAYASAGTPPPGVLPGWLGHRRRGRAGDLGAPQCVVGPSRAAGARPGGPARPCRWRRALGRGAGPVRAGAGRASQPATAHAGHAPGRTCAVFPVSAGQRRAAARVRPQRPHARPLPHGGCPGATRRRHGRLPGRTDAAQAAGALHAD